MRLNEAPVFFSSVLRPKHPKNSHLDTFNRMLPVMRNSIAGSVDGLCLDAIAKNLMTFPEQAGIWRVATSLNMHHGSWSILP